MKKGCEEMTTELKATKEEVKTGQEEVIIVQ